jgi:hypothetical protein
MSLAIGLWLFDASSGYSKYSETLSENMLAGFGVSSRNVNDVTNSKKTFVNPFSPAKHTEQEKNKHSSVVSDKHSLYKWLL